jgi:CheY-like chemotaxis protein
MEVSLDGLRVLVAEDTKTNQALIERILSKFGCRVVIAENGQVALARLTEDHFDVVLMDCHMPEMDGYEATRALRGIESEQPLRKRLPVIALTANALTGDKEACLAAGMDDYLTKPVKRDELRASLVRAMTETLHRGSPSFAQGCDER